MKKIFSILLLAMVVVLPMNTFAEESNMVLVNGQIPCVADELEPNKFNCTVSMNTTGGSSTSFTLNVVEHNAKIDRDSIEASTGWVVDDSNYPTLTFTNATGSTGNYQLFTFTYEKNTSGEDCRIEINGQSTAPTTDKDVDTPEENKQTGVTLPYIFLGGALLIAGYAFIATKNKSKMYRL